ncbi:MAG TPA: hypothetical protein VFV10_19930 [Gammaproteobacteria bacterium]|nr:hypothetical protein [Gammaproteobacteria bacterium]
MKDEKPSDSKPSVDSVSTRLISREAVCDGVRFHWWSVGERPALVTVTSSLFGTKNGFTDADPETYAQQLMRTLIPEPAVKSERRRKPNPGPSPSALDKPGWFKKT